MTVPRVTLVVMTDGRRQYLERTLASFEAMVDTSAITHRIVVDDCAGNQEFVEWVDTLGFDQHIRPEPAKRGYARAMQTAWDHLGECDFVVHLEEDFVFQRHWDIADTTEFMQCHPYLAQVALRRQAWHSSEDETISIVDMSPSRYSPRHDSRHDWNWLEHTMFFTLNPCIYPRSITTAGWPRGANSEARFGDRIFRAGLSCAYWGKLDDQPWVMHIGFERTGFDY